MSWLTDLFDTKKLKKAANDELNRHKPYLLGRVDMLAIGINQDIEAGRVVTLAKDVLVNKVRDEVRRALGLDNVSALLDPKKALMLAGLEIALNLAGSYIDMKGDSSKGGMKLAVNRAADRIKKQIQGARL